MGGGVWDRDSQVRDGCPGLGAGAGPAAPAACAGRGRREWSRRRPTARSPCGNPGGGPACALYPSPSRARRARVPFAFSPSCADCSRLLRIVPSVGRVTKIGSGCPRTPVYKQDPRPQPKAPQAESPEISVLLPLGLSLSVGLVSGLSLPVYVLDVKNVCAIERKVCEVETA